MNGPTSLQRAGNLFNVTSDIGLGLCALGEVLQAVDAERIQGDHTVNGLGCLLGAIGDALLETAHHGKEIVGEVHV